MFQFTLFTEHWSWELEKKEETISAVFKEKVESFLENSGILKSDVTSKHELRTQRNSTIYRKEHTLLFIRNYGREKRGKYWVCLMLGWKIHESKTVRIEDQIHANRALFEDLNITTPAASFQRDVWNDSDSLPNDARRQQNDKVVENKN